MGLRNWALGCFIVAGLAFAGAPPPVIEDTSADAGQTVTRPAPTKATDGAPAGQIKGARISVCVVDGGTTLAGTGSVNLFGYNPNMNPAIVLADGGYADAGVLGWMPIDIQEVFPADVAATRCQGKGCPCFQWQDVSYSFVAAGLWRLEAAPNGVGVLGADGGGITIRTAITTCPTAAGC